MINASSLKPSAPRKRETDKYRGRMPIWEEGGIALMAKGLMDF